ncbi:Pentatricopeptide repeat-containing protein, partial [Thalictrum thalictroides]
MHCDGMLPSGTMRMSLKRFQDAGCIDGKEDFVRELEPERRIRSIGSCMDDSDVDFDYGEVEDRDGHKGLVDGDGVQLKPWLNHGALASALSYWNSDEVSALEDAKFVWTTRYVRCLEVLRNWKQHGSSFVGLLTSLKPDAALNVFYDVETLSGAISQTHLMLLYASLLRTLIKRMRGLNAMDVLEKMIWNSTRYADIYWIDAIIVRAYCKRERAALDLRVYEDMKSSIPDSATKALLVKSLWKEGKLREAAYVEEISEEVNDKQLPIALPGHLWT